MFFFPPCSAAVEKKQDLESVTTLMLNFLNFVFSKLIFSYLHFLMRSLRKIAYRLIIEVLINVLSSKKMRRINRVKIKMFVHNM